MAFFFLINVTPNAKQRAPVAKTPSGILERQCPRTRGKRNGNNIPWEMNRKLSELKDGIAATKVPRENTTSSLLLPHGIELSIGTTTDRSNENVGFQWEGGPRFYYRATW
jgi:hypothetical protein